MGQGYSLEDDAPPDQKSDVPKQFHEQVHNLLPISHPVMCGFHVVRYGVLGFAESSGGSPAPYSAIDAVVVDSAFAGQIGERNEPSAAQHSRKAVYSWLGIHTKDGRFPEEVHQYFRAECVENGQGDGGQAKYYKYRSGQHVIHAIGPVLDELEQSIQGLTETYSNVLLEFCKARGPVGNAANNGASNDTAVPCTLRMLPISTDGLVRNKNLEDHVGRIFWSAMAIAIERLPREMQRRLEQSRVEICIFRDPHVKLFEVALREKREVAENVLKLGADLGAAPAVNASFDWIRKSNADVQRLQRLGAACKTFHAIWKQQYQLPDGTIVRLQNFDKMVAGTCIRRANDSQYVECNSREPSRVVVAPPNQQSVIDIARNYGDKAGSVVAVSAASAYHIGGGCLTGGRHALEEAWCMTSTLIKSLQHAKMTKAGTSIHGGAYIPHDGVVLSPSVEIFRGGTDCGYAFLSKPIVLAGIVSVAMYNCNARVRDAPADVPLDLEEYENGVRQKVRAMIVAAAELGAKVFVCPDVGCGVFENDPVKVGTLLGDVLREPSMAGLVEEIVVTGNPLFTEAVVKASKGEPLQSSWTPPSAATLANVKAAADAARRPRGASPNKAPAATGSGERDAFIQKGSEKDKCVIF